MRYAIWNNKGGVGKTFLTFVIACAYAEEHPDKAVVMMDLCPQANLSEITLGGNGPGGDKLDKLIADHVTIGGYFDARIRIPQDKTGTEISFLISDLTRYNPLVPKNLFFVAGDPSLEIQSQTINQISAQTLPPDTWKNVHNWVTDIVDAIEHRFSNPTIFIDCNPSFASYTELALLAAERLIVPCSADGSSARAIDNVGRLVYGTGDVDEYGEATFNKKALIYHFSLPSIHIVTLNRSTQYDAKASKSFDAMFKEIQRRTNDLEKSGKVSFSMDINNRFLDMPDAHSVAVVCSHEGAPLSKLKLGPHMIHDTKVQVNEIPFARYNDSLMKLVSTL